MIKTIMISILALLLFVFGYFYVEIKLDKRTYENSMKTGESFLLQAFQNNDVNYFTQHLYSIYYKDEQLKEEHIEAFKSFINKFGKLVTIKRMKVRNFQLKLDKGKISDMAEYFVLVDFEKIKDVQFSITLIQNEKKWCFYGFSFTDENAPYIK